MIQSKRYSCFKNTSQEFRLTKLKKARTYFVEEIKQNELMSTQHKKVCVTPDYIENFLILVSVVARCIYIFAFASLTGIPIGIVSSEIGLKISAITAGSKKYKSIINKKKKNMIKQYCQ